MTNAIKLSAPGLGHFWPNGRFIKASDATFGHKVAWPDNFYCVGLYGIGNPWLKSKDLAIWMPWP